MSITIVEEVSPEYLIVDVKTDKVEGRKLVSREEYRSGTITFMGDQFSEAPRWRKGKAK